MQNKNLFFLIGLMGCGKTTTAKQIAQDLNINFIDTDEQIELQENDSISNIFKTKGEEYFRKLELEVLNKIIQNSNTTTIIATGGGMPCYNNAIELMNTFGTTIWLNLDIESIYINLKNDSNKRPVLLHLNEKDMKNKLKELLDERTIFYSQANYIVSHQADFISSIKKIILSTNNE